MPLLDDFPACRHGSAPTKAWVTRAGPNVGQLCVHLKNGQPPPRGGSFAQLQVWKQHFHLCRPATMRLCQRPGMARPLVVKHRRTCAACAERVAA